MDVWLGSWSGVGHDHRETLPSQPLTVRFFAARASITLSIMSWGRAEVKAHTSRPFVQEYPVAYLIHLRVVRVPRSPTSKRCLCKLVPARGEGFGGTRRVMHSIAVSGRASNDAKRGGKEEERAVHTILVKRSHFITHTWVGLGHEDDVMEPTPGDRAEKDARAGLCRAEAFSNSFKRAGLGSFSAKKAHQIYDSWEVDFTTVLQALTPSPRWSPGAPEPSYWNELPQHSSSHDTQSHRK